MNVIPLAAESMGVRSMATFVEVDSTGSYIKSPDIHIDVQPGTGACVASNPGVVIC